MRRATYTLLLAHLKFATAQDKEPFVTIAFKTNFDKPMYDNVDTLTAIKKVVASTAGSSVSPSDVVPCVLSDVMSNGGASDGGRRRRLFGVGSGGGGGETKLQKVHICIYPATQQVADAIAENLKTAWADPGSARAAFLAEFQSYNVFQSYVGSSLEMSDGVIRSTRPAPFDLTVVIIPAVSLLIVGLAFVWFANKKGWLKGGGAAVAGKGNEAATTAPPVVAAVVSPSDAPVAAATAVVATATAATTISIPFPAGGFQNRPAEADIFQTHQRPFKIDSQFGPGGKTYVVIWTHKSAYDAGLREGMQVVSIYGKPIKNTLTVNDLLFSFVKSDGKKGPLVVEVMGAATETAVA
jgi:hypothetical protein